MPDGASGAEGGAAGMAAQIIGLGRDVDSLRRLVQQHDRTVRTISGRLADLEVQAGSSATTLAALTEQITELAGGGQELGAHRSWFATTDLAQARSSLVDLVGWLDGVYLQFPDAALPSCWLWHPSVVEELLWLRRSWTRSIHREHGRDLPRRGLARPAAPRRRDPHPRAERRSLLAGPARTRCRARPASAEGVDRRRRTTRSSTGGQHAERNRRPARTRRCAPAAWTEVGDAGCPTRRPGLGLRRRHSRWLSLRRRQHRALLRAARRSLPRVEPAAGRRRRRRLLAGGPLRRHRDPRQNRMARRPAVEDHPARRAPSRGRRRGRRVVPTPVRTDPLLRGGRSHSDSRPAGGRWPDDRGLSCDRRLSAGGRHHGDCRATRCDSDDRALAARRGERATAAAGSLRRCRSAADGLRAGRVRGRP